MRHSDPSLCAIGALGLYLLHRFEVLEEKISYHRNSDWFDVKLLRASGAKSDPTKSISDKVYATQIANACKHHQIHTNHYVHIGRCGGVVTAEMNELDSQAIKVLGNWNPDCMDAYYSAKLPMKSLRMMAGYGPQKESFYCPRAALEPPEALRKQLFPFVEEIRDWMENESSEPHSTLSNFVRTLDRLRSIIFQDVAVLGNVRNHVIFDLPVFQTPEFQQFRDQMQLHLCNSKNPYDATMELILPGINDKLVGLQSQAQIQQQEIIQNFQRLEQKMDGVRSDQLRFFTHLGNFEPSQTQELSTNSAEDARSSCNSPPVNVRNSNFDLIRPSHFENMSLSVFAKSPIL